MSNRTDHVENMVDTTGSYYTLWRSESYKCKALERENERLEQRVSELMAKLEREMYQQVEISLKWRRTVSTLIDENTRLSMQLHGRPRSLNDEETSSNSHTATNNYSASKN